MLYCYRFGRFGGRQGPGSALRVSGAAFRISAGRLTELRADGGCGLQLRAGWAGEVRAEPRPCGYGGQTVRKPGGIRVKLRAGPETRRPGGIRVGLQPSEDRSAEVWPVGIAAGWDRSCGPLVRRRASADRREPPPSVRGSARPARWDPSSAPPPPERDRECAARCGSASSNAGHPVRRRSAFRR